MAERQDKNQPDSGLPGGGKGRIDVTGKPPDSIHVDPNITEGHPGYDESGGSEIIPPGRRADEKSAEEKSTR